MYRNLAARIMLSVIPLFRGCSVDFDCDRMIRLHRLNPNVGCEREDFRYGLAGNPPDEHAQLRLESLRWQVVVPDPSASSEKETGIM